MKPVSLQDAGKDGSVAVLVSDFIGGGDRRIEVLAASVDGFSFEVRMLRNGYVNVLATRHGDDQRCRHDS